MGLPTSEVTPRMVDAQGPQSSGLASLGETPGGCGLRLYVWQVTHGPPLAAGLVRRRWPWAGASSRMQTQRCTAMGPQAYQVELHGGEWHGQSWHASSIMLLLPRDLQFAELALLMAGCACRRPGQVPVHRTVSASRCEDWQAVRRAQCCGWQRGRRGAQLQQGPAVTPRGQA